MTIRLRPFLQHGKLLGFALQLLEDSSKKDIDQVFEINVPLEVERISGFIRHTINGFVVNRLVRKLAGLVPTEVVCNTSNDLLEVFQKTPIVCKVLAISGAAFSGGLSAELDCGNRGIDQFLTAGSRQVARKSRLVFKVFQKALGQSGKLPPLLVRYRRKGVVHIRKGSVLLLSFPRLRFFRFHSKKRVWRISRKRRANYDRGNSQVQNGNQPWKPPR